MTLRRYSNELPIEEYAPEDPTELRIGRDGRTVFVETLRLSPVAPDAWDVEEGAGERGVDATERRARELPSEADACVAFAQEILALVPRRAELAGELLVSDTAVGPVQDSNEHHWIRVDELAPETAEPVVGPTDGDAQVLADWLLGQADPASRARGEVINLQVRGDLASLERARALVADWADAWVSGLLPYARLGFRLGFVETLELRGDDQDEPIFAATTGPRELERFLALPIASRLRRLVLGAVGPVAISGNPFVDNTALVGAIGRSGAPTLRELELREGDADDLAALAGLPALERLTIETFVNDVGTLTSASLRELRYRGKYAPRDLAALDVRRLPHLESLEVRAEQLEAVVRVLAASPLVRQLRTLTLVGPLADATIVRQPAFANLDLRLS